MLEMVQEYVSDELDWSMVNQENHAMDMMFHSETSFQKHLEKGYLVYLCTILLYALVQNRKNTFSIEMHFHTTT